MNYTAIRQRLPRFLYRRLFHFEAAIEDAVAAFAEELPPGSRVLDAGAGEGKQKPRFSGHCYIGLDLCIGDPDWDYRGIDVIGDVLALPFAGSSFDACLNLVTLEHVREPGAALLEIARVLRPGGRLLLVVPQEWEIHQAPHDYFRFTRYGVKYLLENAGFTRIQILAAGGYFRLLARRLLNGVKFFRGIRFAIAAALLVPPALLLPVLDRLDRDRSFTLGYICTARRR